MASLPQLHRKKLRVHAGSLGIEYVPVLPPAQKPTGLVAAAAVDRHREATADARMALDKIGILVMSLSSVKL